MGWSWAPFLAQTAAEDLIGSVLQLLSERAESSEVVEDFDDVSSGIGLDDDPSQPARRYYPARSSARRIYSV